MRLRPCWRQANVNYIGHLDPAHIFHDEADVIVCDGFTGNVVIKTAEATAEYAFGELRAEVLKRPVAKLAALGPAAGVSRPAAADRLCRNRRDAAARPQGPALDRTRPLQGARRDQRAAGGRPRGARAARTHHRLRIGSRDDLAALDVRSRSSHAHRVSDTHAFAAPGVMCRVAHGNRTSSCMPPWASPMCRPASPSVTRSSRQHLPSRRLVARVE